MEIINAKNIIFREIGEGDEDMINSFFDLMGGETRALFNRRDYNRRGVLKYISRPDATRRYWVALCGEEMIGYVFFLDFNTSVPTLGLAVRDDLRGKGIGGILVDFAIDKIKETGKGGIFLTTHVANIRAQALYESKGFISMGLAKNGSELSYLFRFLEK
jgi:ribosomal protein S18 acetylase RimI-like enzyme